MSDPALQAYVEQLSAAHENVEVSDDELLRLSNWIDVNCPYHPSYWGRLNASYERHPGYRPLVSFEDALSRTIPESILRAESAGSDWTTSIE